MYIAELKIIRCEQLPRELLLHIKLIRDKWAAYNCNLEIIHEFCNNWDHPLSLKNNILVRHDILPKMLQHFLIEREFSPNNPGMNDYNYFMKIPNRSIFISLDSIKELFEMAYKSPPKNLVRDYTNSEEYEKLLGSEKELEEEYMRNYIKLNVVSKNEGVKSYNISEKILFGEERIVIGKEGALIRIDENIEIGLEIKESSYILSELGSTQKTKRQVPFRGRVYLKLNHLIMMGWEQYFTVDDIQTHMGMFSQDSQGTNESLISIKGISGYYNGQIFDFVAKVNCFEYYFGRCESCAVQFPSKLGISSVHCCIGFDNYGWYISDGLENPSSNGTYVFCNFLHPKQNIIISDQIKLEPQMKFLTPNATIIVYIYIHTSYTYILSTYIYIYI